MMIAAIEKNLNKGISLLENISDFEYSDSTVPPYFSSIGCHVRHILDVFNCVLNGYEDGKIDLTTRDRNELIEQKTKLGVEYFNDTISRLYELTEADLTSEITVVDNMGLGVEEVSTTLGAILMQAQSHAIHHYASVGYVIHQLGISLPDNEFGFNPTKPKKGNFTPN